MKRKIKRKIITAEDQQEILKKYLDGYSMTDLAEVFGICLASVRSILKIVMDTDSPLQSRKKLWSENKFVPVHLEDRLDANGKKKSFKKDKRFFKSIPVVAELINCNEITHADIARKLRCSREYVGQVAEALADCGIDVSRKNDARGRVAQRGVVA